MESDVKMTTFIDITVPEYVGNEDIPGICMCCLSQESPMINLQTCKHKVFLDLILKYKMETLNNYVCVYCHTMLKKFDKFKQQVQDNQQVFNEQIPELKPSKMSYLQISKVEFTSSLDEITEICYKSDPIPGYDLEMDVKVEQDFSDQDIPLAEVKKQKSEGTKKIKKKKRSENWSTEEKNILRKMILQSRHIVEDKSTKTSSNIKKAQEWKKIAQKLNVLMGKNRSDSDVKLAWKRMKLAAKAKLSTHRQHQVLTGGGEKPKSPSQDLAIMAIASHDSVAEFNKYDSDEIKPSVESKPLKNKEIAGPSTDYSEDIISPECNDVVEDIMDQAAGTFERRKTKIHSKKGPQNIKVAIQKKILESNTQFKKKQLEMLEVEHGYNIIIAKLKIKKLQLEIELLENRKNSST